MMQPVSRTSGQTSTQYLVQATNRSSTPRSRSVTVTLGWSDTTRCGIRFSGMIELYKQNANGEAGLRPGLVSLAFLGSRIKTISRQIDMHCMCAIMRAN